MVGRPELSIRVDDTGQCVGVEGYFDGRNLAASLIAKANPADRRAPGKRWASRTGIDASAPLRKPSFKQLPSNT
jgi:hypothetical protein